MLLSCNFILSRNSPCFVALASEQKYSFRPLTSRFMGQYEFADLQIVVVMSLLHHQISFVLFTVHIGLQETPFLFFYADFIWKSICNNWDD